MKSKNWLLLFWGLLLLLLLALQSFGRKYEGTLWVPILWFLINLLPLFFYIRFAEHQTPVLGRNYYLRVGFLAIGSLMLYLLLLTGVILVQPFLVPPNTPAGVLLKSLAFTLPAQAFLMLALYSKRIPGSVPIWSPQNPGPEGDSENGDVKAEEYTYRLKGEERVELDQLIGKARVEEAIDRLVLMVQQEDPVAYRSALLLQKRYRRLRKKEIEDRISEREADLKSSQITGDLLDLLSALS
jgi:hypothetical protein